MAQKTEDDFRFPQQPAATVEEKMGKKRDGRADDRTSSIAGRAVQMAEELRAHVRQEASQGQLSPTDNALMLRIEDFLRNEVGALKR